MCGVVATEVLHTGRRIPRRVRLPRDRRAAQVAAGFELVTGAAGVIGGALLAARPDGSLLAARLSALEGSPFSDWRAPGLLLATLVGGGGIVAGGWLAARRPYAPEMSVVYGLGLLSFELAEVSWIGFQPLEVVFGVVGALVSALAWRGRSAVGPEDRER